METISLFVGSTTGKLMKILVLMRKSLFTCGLLAAPASPQQLQALCGWRDRLRRLYCRLDT